MFYDLYLMLPIWKSGWTYSVYFWGLSLTVPRFLVYLVIFYCVLLSKIIVWLSQDIKWRHLPLERTDVYFCLVLRGTAGDLQLALRFHRPPQGWTWGCRSSVASVHVVSLSTARSPGSAEQHHDHAAQRLLRLGEGASCVLLVCSSLVLALRGHSLVS